MASPGNQHCANCIGTLSFPISISCVLNADSRRQVDELISYTERTLAYRLGLLLYFYTDYQQRSAFKCIA